MSPPVWNSGSTVSSTEAGPMQAGPPRLTQFQNVMPWVMVAPLGWPVVPDVYMMVETSSSVTSSARASGLADAMPVS
ncbi:hypothetical protein ACVMHY_010894 [Bradyrhizobium barranii subsp. barranii]